MTQPLVSVLLCTHDRHNRRDFVKKALKCYESQTWQNKELIVVDSGNNDIYDLVEDIGHLGYIHDEYKNLAVKRNVGIEMAYGDYIIHFDDDDWSGPLRIQHQVTEMFRWPGVKIVGYRQSLWWDINKKITAFYDGPLVWGATICYRKDWALIHKWNELVATSEDVPFVKQAGPNEVIVLPDNRNFVATQHKGSAIRDLTKPPFAPVSNNELPGEFRHVFGIRL